MDIYIIGIIRVCWHFLFKKIARKLVGRIKPGKRQQNICQKITTNKHPLPFLNELKQYNPELLHKERLLAITKSDMLDDELKAEISKDLPAIPYLFISSVAQQGLTELKDLIWKHLNHDWIAAAHR